MRRIAAYLPILILASAMALLLAFHLSAQQTDMLACVRFLDSTHGQALTPYYDQEADTYHLFLPAHLSQEALTAHPRHFGTKLTFSGGQFQELPADTDITVTATSLLHSQSYTLQIHRCDTLPTIYIQAKDQTLSHLHQDKNNKSEVFLTMVDADGAVLLEQTATLSGRGNGSWSGEKRPYTLSFSEPVSVGPFENADKLRLLAEASDESKLRNSIVYHAAQALNFPYASAYTYVNVYIGGEFRGLYGMVTKEEYEKHIEEDAIQAVFEIASGENRQEFFSSGFEKRIHVMYGSLDTIQAQVNAMEEALISQDWDRCAQLLDLRSFAEKYALEEFFANYDLVFGSQYFYLDQNHVIHCMLPWDYDWTLGSSVTYFNDAQAIELRAFRDSSWYSSLLNWETFRQETLSVLEEDYTEAFFDSLDRHTQATIQAIRTSRSSDQIRWRNYPPSTYPIASGMEDLTEFAVWFREYYSLRKSFLTSWLRDPGAYARVTFIGEHLGSFFIPRGENLMDHLGSANILTAPLSDGRSHTWYTPEGQTPEDIGAVTEDLDFLSIALEEEAPASQERTASQRLKEYGGKLLFLIIFILSALLLGLAECRRNWHRKKIHT